MNEAAREEMDDGDSWTPPTEAEMKVILAKRERSDKISKLMGEYLLKGYKMLGSTCDVCGTILLKDKHNNNYCVACSELDSDLAKDDPALSARAASSQVQEGEFQGAVSSSGAEPSPQRVLQPVLPMDIQMNGASASSSPSVLFQSHRQTAGSPRPGTFQELHKDPTTSWTFSADERANLLECEMALQSKLRWATQELQKVSSADSSIPLCALIKACAEALKSLRSLAKD